MRATRFAIVLCVLAACGPRYEYPEAEVRRLVARCDKADAKDACLCVIETYQNEIPYEDLKAFQEGHAPYTPYSKGGEASAEWKQMNRRLGEIAADCLD